MVKFLSFNNDLFTETTEDLLNAIKLEEIDFKSDPWPTISSSAKDLLSKMLTRDPEKRITAAEVLGMLISSCRFLV